MPERIIDQEARDQAGRALALISQHQTVCTEIEKRRAMLDAEREKNENLFRRYIEDQLAAIRTETKQAAESQERFLKAIQTGYDISYRDFSNRIAADVKDLSGRHSAAINTLAMTMSNLDTKLTAQIETHKKQQDEVTDNIYNRLWAAALGIIAALAGVSWEFFKSLQGIK